MPVSFFPMADWTLILPRTPLELRTTNRLASHHTRNLENRTVSQRHNKDCLENKAIVTIRAEYMGTIG